MTTGNWVCAKPRLLRISLTTWKPVSPGIITSRSINDGNSLPESRYSNASMPFMARTIRYSAPSVCSMTSWLMSSSSTESTSGRWPTGGATPPTGAVRAACAATCLAARLFVAPLPSSWRNVRAAHLLKSHGRTTVNVEPWPAFEVTRSSPPWSFAMLMATERPKPMPWKLRESLFSSCWKGSKIFFSASGEMPMPVSVTSISNMLLSRSSRAESWMDPEAVNLAAFVTKLYSSCVIL
mmetsp:Transcript_10008/g.29080  ORF Transcript_10008/g.29080 Transcript_10008/m.29080 type:complete len:238 (+) Transcript_10008:1198-1911(+)